VSEVGSGRPLILWERSRGARGGLKAHIPLSTDFPGLPRALLGSRNDENEHHCSPHKSEEKAIQILKCHAYGLTR
jgi:hypothetical protein